MTKLLAVLLAAAFAAAPFQATAQDKAAPATEKTSSEKKKAGKGEAKKSGKGDTKKKSAQ